MSPQAWGATLGLLAAAGLLLIASWVRARRPLTVAERIGPFVLGSTGRRARPDASSSWATLWMLARPTRVGGISVRRPRSGSGAVGTVSLDDARLQQVTWGVFGGAAGCIVGVVLAIGGSSPVGVLVLGTTGAAVGALLLDRHRAQQRHRRRGRIDQSLPNVAELLAFAVAAGESPVAALERVAGTTAGDLTDEISRTIEDIRSGIPLDAALLGLGERAGTPAAQRFVDGLVVAMERGTPLSEVMRAQAADCRADERRRLMELAGRKDVLMLVPVVFFILPTVVLVALFPGIQALSLVVS